ncbi:hypothetical protein C8R43DRAFT_246967 [Mycena crocata]|nr:hypothetical protein C8R43DRAFT_246967 [Mycena crocata]
MAETMSPSLAQPILMYRNDSEESTESPFASVLNTPADERVLHFDSIDAKLFSAGAPQILERLAPVSPVEGGVGRMPRRVSLSRQFTKALAEANESALHGPPPRSRSSSIDRVYAEEYEPPAPHPSPDLMSFASPEMPSASIELQRMQTPEPPISDAYDTSSPQSITTITPRGRPPLRRDLFSPAKKPVTFPIQTEAAPTALEFAPHAHSTLRHRKGMFPNDNITGEPSDVFNEINLHDTARNEPLQSVVDDEALDELEDDLDMPSLPPISPLLPLQLFLFPVWCVLVGATILLCPTHLPAIAFPASTSFGNTSSSCRARMLSAAQSAFAHCLPFTAPPSPIRTFAHWATVAHLHIAIFLSVLVGVMYVAPPLGALLTAACAGQFIHAWGDFAVEDGELGGDVRQMLYQVVGPDCGFQNGDALDRVGGKYFLRRMQVLETRADILAAGGVEEEFGSDTE